MAIMTRRSSAAATFAFLLVLAPAEAGASELSAGISLGWIQVGTVPLLMVAPHAGIGWHVERELLFAVHDLCGILPPIQEDRFGVYNQASVAVGYA